MSKTGDSHTAARVLLVVCVLATNGCALLDSGSLDSILTAARGDETDERTVIAGLKEALRIGTSRTVDATSIVDGYLANELIRISMPQQLDKMTRTLRRVGLGQQVDELETAMNRAAEQAAGESTDVFFSAITEMTIADGYGILRGGESAATDYFRGRTAADLRARFHPIVVEKMDEVGLSRLYTKLAERYGALPFVTKPAVDLDEYVTDEALSGLFTILADEERRIREDPAARTTELLRRVFGG